MCSRCPAEAPKQRDYRDLYYPRLSLLARTFSISNTCGSGNHPSARRLLNLSVVISIISISHGLSAGVSGRLSHCVSVSASHCTSHCTSAGVDCSTL